MLLPIIALTLAIQKESDTWDLKLVVDPKTKLTWGVTVDAQAEGQDHHAAFVFGRTVKSTDEKKPIVTFSWDKLEVDDQEGQDVPPWDAVVGKRGEIQRMDGDLDDAYRRMLSPFVFIYPDKPVTFGDKWNYEAKPTGTGAKVTYSYEAKKSELVKDVQAIVIAGKYVEDGKDGATGDGVWWVSRAGRVLKFEFKIKNWVVPMAGQGSVDATLKGLAQ